MLIAGVGHESLIETLKRIEHAASLDYDLALVRTPHFYPSSNCVQTGRDAELLPDGRGRIGFARPALQHSRVYSL